MNSPSEPKPGEALLTSIEVSEILKVSLHTLRAMTRSGRIPCVRFSQKTIRYMRSDIDALLLSLKEGSR